eukprot:GAFH01004238.1.p3 GENE.GAFH01004238.1~~GAFH01004238.1.p3  ORF type:complete len:146 (+),score=43.44 GAFH01004238.1:263-700(+)
MVSNCSAGQRVQEGVLAGAHQLPAAPRVVALHDRLAVEQRGRAVRVDQQRGRHAGVLHVVDDGRQHAAQRLQRRQGQPLPQAAPGEHGVHGLHDVGRVHGVVVGVLVVEPVDLGQAPLELARVDAQLGQQPQPVHAPHGQVHQHW